MAYNDKERQLREYRDKLQREIESDFSSYQVFGKSAPRPEDPHKNNPEPISGGCGDPRCRLCYNQETGQLNAEDGKFQTGGDSSDRPRAIRGTWAPISTYDTLSYKDDSAMLQAREPVAKYILDTTHQVPWDSIIGNLSAREALQEAVEASTTHAALYKHYEMKPPRGVLLWGPPGCGKTMFGKATATALGRIYKSKVELMVINGPELESPIVGIAAQKVISIFNYAREYKRYHGHPLVIFLDEADALLKSRESSPWASEIVGQFLTELDGMEECGAFVILATNRPDELDAALLRDGRCDRKIKVERPDYEAAKAIAQGVMKKGVPWLLEPSLDFVDDLFHPRYLLKELINPETHVHHQFTLSHIVSGAMIVGLVSRAKSIAFRRDKAAGTITGIVQADFRLAVEELYTENKGLRHEYAMREFVQEIALPTEEARAALNRTYN